MADNYVTEGKNLTLTNAALASKDAGDPVVVGKIVGVALIDADANNKCTFATEGIFDLPVKGHDGTANSAVAVGDALYYTAGDAFLDKDSAQVLFGYALEAVSSGQTATIEVLLAK